MAAERRHDFSMTSAADQLEPMRGWLRGELAALDLSHQDQWALLTAVGELCANSIAHAYGGEPGNPIRVSVETFDDRLVIEVEDFGRPFDPDAYVRPDLDALPGHGVGLHIVGLVADEVSFDTARPRGTRWTLVKYWRAIRT